MDGILPSNPLAHLEEPDKSGVIWEIPYSGKCDGVRVKTSKRELEAVIRACGELS